MATVFRAFDRRMGRAVAVKVLHPELTHLLGPDRFHREVSIAAALQHPNIVPVYESGDDGGLLYFTMPLVEGETLRARLVRETQLPLDDALRIAKDVAEALHCAHGHGIVHRDIKPENILLTGDRAVVADFGVARAITEAGGDRLTSSGMAIGTPAYMSPEQASGDVHLDGRADIYALACVLYEMLGGEPPFTGPSAQAVLARQMQESPRSLHVVRATVSPALQRAIETALAKVPADRYATVGEFVAALEQARRSPGWGAAKRWRIAWGASALIAAAACAWLLWPRPPRLDPLKIVVFPLQARGDSALRGDGVALGSLLNSALESAEPLKVVDGWTWLTPDQRRDPTLIAVGDLGRIARGQHARYALGGWVLRSGDSARVAVQLLDVRGDSTLPQVSEAGLFGPHFIADLGIRAVVGLLSRFLAPGRRVDLQLLQGHNPAAVVATVGGDLDYRDGKFSSALAHYRRALDLDSTMVLAALKGASAANWNHDVAAAIALVDVGLRHSRGAPARYRAFATGLRAYLADDPVAAAAGFDRAISLDSDWTEAWMARGEVHYHFLFGGWNPDSLAALDFERAHRLDPGFTPALYHLGEIEMRRGWTARADSLYGALRRARPDSSWLRKATWMMRCVRDGPDAVDWDRAARGAGDASFDVVVVGHGIAKAQPACAERAMRAALYAAPRESVTTRWSALVGLQTMLVAEGRYSEVRRLLAWGVENVHIAAHTLQLVDAVAGVGTDSGAVAGLRDPALGGPRAELHGHGPRWLWWHGMSAWLRRDGVRMREIVAVLADTMRVGQRDGSDTMLYGAFAARLAVLRADTARAIALLTPLSPRGSMGAIGWEWMASLAEERLLLAKLLLARGRYADALAVAGALDAGQAMAYALYLPDGLEVRIRAAAALHDGALADRFRKRLTQLRQARGG
jgi:tetratricopeptide (TPR) repeat protein/TolB-like protein